MRSMGAVPLDMQSRSISVKSVRSMFYVDINPAGTELFSEISFLIDVDPRIGPGKQLNLVIS